MVKMIVLLFCILAPVSAFEHYVSLRDVTPESGLPEHVLIDVIGSDGEVTSLHLKQNKRLNENADVYEREHDGRNTIRRLKTNNQHLENIKYYHDKQNRAAVSVACEKRIDEPCKRTLEGFLDIGNDTYEIRPVNNSLLKRMFRTRDFNIHAVKRLTFSTENYPKVMTADQQFEFRDYIDTKGFKNVHHKGNTFKRQPQTEYAVECVLVVDTFLWKKFSDRIEGAGDKEEETKYKLRRHLTHVMNGVSLRYESIEDPDLNIYVTISRFIFMKNNDENSPVPKGVDAPILLDEKCYIDAEKYVFNSAKWLYDQTSMENDDHVMVFTACDLINKTIEKNSVAGIAYVGGACNKYRVSVQENGDYYTLATVAAHELGHNLGAHHDGHSSNNCKKEDRFLMAPRVTRLSYTEKYIINPWRFSPCSIEAFKSYFSEYGSCLTDHGDFFDKTEWEEHNKKLPGEIRSLDLQCKYFVGDYSGVCPESIVDLSETDERICQQMYCVYKSPKCRSCCVPYTPARGSACGNPGDNKWCIEGSCVTKENGTESNEGNDCLATTAHEYTGHDSMTEYGNECAPWTVAAETYPSTYFDSDFPESSIDEASNYCRSPDQDSRLWCYTRRDDGLLYWEYCDVPKC